MISTSNDKLLFQREIQLTVGDLDVSDFRIVFKAKKNLKTEPNTCTVQVYNLGPENRAKLEQPTSKKLPVRLEAGYKDTGTSQIFLGEARAAWTEWDGPDAITTITTGDSEKEMQESRLHLSIGPLVPVETALLAMVRALKIGEGNVGQAVAMLKSKGVASMFGPGSAVSGSVKRMLTDFCRSADLEWSIQDGRLQILNRGKALADQAVVLTSDTGLKGSPSTDFKGKVKAKSFLIPELAPGRKVVFESRSVNGGYRIEQVEFSGDTHGADWDADLLCAKY